MNNRKILTVGITVSLLSLAVLGLIAISADAARTGTGTITITVVNEVNGRTKPVEGATVVVRDTSISGTTNRRGQVSFSSASLLEQFKPSNINFWADATYVTTSGSVSGCIPFFPTSTKATVILGSCAVPPS